MFFGRRFAGYHKGKSSGLDILVLSIIKNDDGSLTGYDIIQKLNKQFRGMGSTSAGTIYPLLNRLGKKDLIKSREVIESKRQRKIYIITDKGIDELKRVLERNLEPSINSLGDFIKTIFKASMPSEETMVRMIGHFPFPGFNQDYEINEYDYSLDNIERLKRIISHLEKGKQSLEKRLNGLEIKIEKYKEVLEKIRVERDEHAKVIEIIDDDDEFDNF